MNQSNLEKDIIATIALVAGALMLEGCTLIALQLLACSVMSATVQVLTIAVAVGVGSLLYPFCLLRYQYEPQPVELGIRRPTWITACVVTLGSLAMVLTIARTGVSMTLFLNLVQNFFVAGGEEFVARGCLFYVLRRYLGNEVGVAAVSALVFVFVFHSNAPLVENLIWRMPITLILVTVYARTKDLSSCIFIHWSYNVFVSI